MLADWIANIGVLSLGAVAVYFVARRDRLQNNSPVSSLILGTMFGVLTAMVVVTPVQITNGSTMDTRAGPAILAGFFLGPIGGLVSASLAGAARAWVGGPFVIGGTLSPFVYSIFGMAAGYLWGQERASPRLFQLVLIAIGGTIFVLPCLFVDQGLETGLEMVEKIGLMLLLGNIAGVTILGLMVGEARRFAAEHRLVKSTLRLTNLARASAGIAIWRYDFDRDRLIWDDAMFDLFGVERSSFAGQFSDWEDTVHPDDLSGAKRAFLTAYHTGSEFASEFRILLPDGTTRWIKAHCSFIEGSDGRITEAVGVNWDFSAEKQLQSNLKEKEQEARLRSEDLEVTLASVVQGVSAFGANRRLRFCNARVKEILGLPDSKLAPNTPYSDFLSYRENADIMEFQNSSARGVLSAATPGEHIRSLIHLQNGKILSFSSAPMPDGGWVETYEDVTEKAIADQRVKKAAETDTLTGLANRLSFNKALENAVDRTKANPASSYTLLLLDLNDFKAVNDQHGHLTGDLLLQKVGAILSDVSQEGDLPARLGGDEYALLLNASGPAEAEVLAERLCHAFDTPLELGGTHVRSGVSIGIAPILQSYAEVEDVLSRADLALYRAKREKGSAFRFYDGRIAEEEAERKQFKHDLIHVVRVRGLQVYCQPVMDLKTGAVDHYEALARWQNNSSSFVPPSNFIPLAEEIGLISEVGDFVFGEVLGMLRRWPDNLAACINVSVLQLGDGIFVQKVIDSLRDLDIRPGRLEVEVTESILMEAGSAAHEDLQKLREAGVRLALDDFGIGFSSLGYLQKLPFDKIKIDRRFVSEVDTSEGSAAIVRSISSLAESLNMTCTAEGIENEQQLEFVTRSGCRYAQGFFIGEPVPLADAVLS